MHGESFASVMRGHAVMAGPSPFPSKPPMNTPGTVGPRQSFASVALDGSLLPLGLPGGGLGGARCQTTWPIYNRPQRGDPRGVMR